MKILIADDDPLILMMLNNSLEKAGHTIVTTSNGDEAFLKAKDGGFDLVITDLIMPGKEGIELIAELREILPDAKIIAMSSDGEAGYSTLLTLAKTFGANETLKKPFSNAQILDLIQSLA